MERVRRVDGMVVEGRWLLDGRHYRIQLQQGLCQAVEPLPTGEDLWLAPGMVDMQVNGYLGVDYSSPQLTVEQVEQACRELMQRGTVRHLATIITNPQHLIEDNLRTIAAARRSVPLVAQAIVGVHMEGPYISPVDGPRGVHDRNSVRAACIAEFDAWQQCSGNLVRLVTLAAEQEGACAFIRHITAQGVIASLGHSDATPAQFEAAVAAGATMATHFGNGTKPELPRFRNVLWWQLGMDQVYPSLIADGRHVDPLVVRVAARAKGLSQLVLVSDVAPVAGLPAGLHYWGAQQVRVHPDGHISREVDGRLAGGGYLLDWCVPHFRRYLDLELVQAYFGASALPARLLGLPSQWQQLPQLGQRADFICFRESDDYLEVVDGFVSGLRIPRKKAEDGGASNG